MVELSTEEYSEYLILKKAQKDLNLDKLTDILYCHRMERMINFSTHKVVTNGEKVKYVRLDNELDKDIKKLVMKKVEYERVIRFENPYKFYNHYHLFVLDALHKVWETLSNEYKEKWFLEKHSFISDGIYTFISSQGIDKHTHISKKDYLSMIHKVNKGKDIA